MNNLFRSRALRKVISDKSTINLVSSGNEAIAHLIGEGKFGDRKAYPFPSIVILDLKMEDGNGFDILEFMQGNPGWNIVPNDI